MVADIRGEPAPGTDTGRGEGSVESSSVGRAFLDLSRTYLRGEYLPKIQSCLGRLAPEDLWWRPNPRSNSVGNLVIHLAGNARQWVVSGIGGRPDSRDRDREFEAGGGWSAEELSRHLREAIEAVDGVLAALDPARLGEPLTVQGIDTTVLGALYHVVEHFSGHAAQIAWITKMRTDEDLGFYRIDPDGRVHTTWNQAEDR